MYYLKSFIYGSDVIPIKENITTIEPISSSVTIESQNDLKHQKIELHFLDQISDELNQNKQKDQNDKNDKNELQQNNYYSQQNGIPYCDQQIGTTYCDGRQGNQYGTLIGKDYVLQQSGPNDIMSLKNNYYSTTKKV